jgi:hypothetical protein
MSDTFNTIVANWQGVDEEPTAESGNLVKSGGVKSFGTQTNAKCVQNIFLLPENIGSLASTKIELYDSATYKVIEVTGNNTLDVYCNTKGVIAFVKSFDFYHTLPYNFDFANGESIHGSFSGAWGGTLSIPADAKYIVFSSRLPNGDVVRWSKFILDRQNLIDVCKNNIIGNGTLPNNTNLNSVERNTVVKIGYGLNYTNLPNDLVSGQVSGTLITLFSNIDEDQGEQILMTASAIYVRYYSGNYFDWKKVSEGDVSDYYKMIGTLPNNTDLNSVKPSISALAWGYNYSNLPSDITSGQTSGTLITYRQSASGDAGGQFYLTYSAIYRRYYSGRYYDWEKLPSSKDMNYLVGSLNLKYPELSYTNNKHIGISGTSVYVSNDNGWKLSESIYLKRGQKIYIKAAGYLTAVSILTQYYKGEPKVCAIPSVDSTYRWYEYTVLANGEYKISGSASANYPIEYYIIDGVGIEDRHPFQTFLNVGVAGDSLANGATITGTTWYSNKAMSWPQVMKRMTGNNIINFTRGGLTTYEWMLDPNNGFPVASLPENTCESYIIALGVNDASRIRKYEEGTPSTDHLYPLGTMSDINDSDYTQNGDSFYGHYAKIIQAIQALHPCVKFFLVKLPTQLEDSQDTQAELSQRLNYAINAISEHFHNCVTIQLGNYADFSTLNHEIRNNERGGHYNAIMYQYFAELIYKALNEKMNDEQWKYRYIELINTEYENLIPSDTY